MIFYKNVLQPAYLSPQINYKMKKLNDTAIAVLAIVSTILSYPSWLPVVLVGNLFSSPAPAIDYTIFLIFCLALFFYAGHYIDFTIIQKTHVLLCGIRDYLYFFSL